MAPLTARRGGLRPSDLASLQPGRFSLLLARRVARGPRERFAEQLLLLAALLCGRRVVKAHLRVRLQQIMESLVHIGGTQPDLSPAAR